MSGIPRLIEHFPYMGIFVLLVLGGIGFPFPEGVTLILCGFLISTGVIKPIPALFIAYSGVLIGDLFAYYLGRKYGRMIVTHKKFHKIILPERLLSLEDRFKKKGTILIIIGGHLVSGIFLVAGIMRMSLSKFLMADAIASILTIIIWVGIGYAGGYSLQVIKKDITRVEHIAILLIIILIVIWLLFRYFKSRQDKNIL